MTEKSVSLGAVLIPDCFAATVPHREKIEAAIYYYKKNGVFDKPLVLNRNFILVDNYARYLAACELGLSEVLYIFSNEIKAWEQERKNQQANMEMSYISAVFPHSKKEYVWKNPNNLFVSEGDLVRVLSKNVSGTKERLVTVRVVRAFVSNDPALQRHNKILFVLRKNGVA